MTGRNICSDLFTHKKHTQGERDMCRFTQILFAIMLMVSSFVVSAADVSGTIWLKSQYVGANGGVFEDLPVLQGTVTVSGDRCSVSLWASTTANGWKARGGDEIDYTVACWRSFGDTKVTGSVGYYDLAMPGGALDYTVRADHRNWYIKFSHYDTGNLPFDGGNAAAVGRNFTFDNAGKWTSSGYIEFNHDFGAFGFEEGAFAKAGASFSHPVGENTLSIGLDWSGPITVRDRRGEVVMWVGISF